uniref:Two component transcriptional regulator n=1 Tax=Acetithermum autotrophicum TaxID=1446466 RepID=H5SQM1_ACEAU|nr:two component transcriptional regulator [Candidatus Acetothermum autotrophicum]
MKILIADDDADSREILKTYFAAKGHEIVLAADGAEALKQFKDEKPDLVLLDIMMPKLDGWEVLHYIRAAGRTPVLMITAKDATDDIVKALSAGADDYIVKPLKLREVEARITAVMRRVQPPAHWRVGDLEINDAEKRVRLEGREIALSPKEYELLKLLASQPGRVFSDEEIIRHVWPEGGLASATDVKRYIYLLRQKIEADPKSPKIILTVPGFGYKLAL